MLEFIRIQRFKTLLDASFPLASVNLFSGLNGMGKSSVLQALLLLRQSYESNTLLSRGLRLKGDYASLGTGKDVLAEQAELNTIEFLLTWAGREPVTFCFDYDMQSDLQPIRGSVDLSAPEELSLFNHRFQYLSANRITPQSSYEVSDYFIRDLNSLGNQGEYTAHFIAENGLKPIPIMALKHPEATTSNLVDNLDKWMAELSPGLRIHAKKQPEINAVSLGYAYEHGKDVTADFMPQNVGFGLTYVLPVVTELLRAKPGDMVIIENPESHLHPAGQAIVGRMCSIAASSGVQLFIETHSDHFLNGVRVAVKDGLIIPDSVRLFFLERETLTEAHTSRVLSPSMDKDGRLDSWPKGFFDEWDNELDKLL
ncbi:MAG: AAA family ATPase [Rectinemataceae bacterium]